LYIIFSDIINTAKFQVGCCKDLPCSFLIA
jgi:hypothetical protein